MEKILLLTGMNPDRRIFDRSIPTIRIHGDRDKTFPLRYTDTDMVIRGGGHVLPLTHPAEIAKALKQIAAGSCKHGFD